MRCQFFLSILISIIILSYSVITTNNLVSKFVKNIPINLGLSNSIAKIQQISDLDNFDYIRGDLNADITVIEYSDYTCLICASVRDILDRLVRQEKVKMVYRHLYRSESGLAYNSGVIAECVGRKFGSDTFFEFSNYLYKNQKDNKNNFADLAGIKFGLLQSEIDACKKEKDIKDRIAKQIKEVKLLGARGTPFILFIYKNNIIGYSYGYEDYDSLRNQLFISIAEFNKTR